MRSSVPGATFHMWMRHRLQAQPAFHCCWVHRVGMGSQGGSPVSALAGASGSGLHRKQPSAGLVTDHSSRGDPAGRHLLVTCLAQRALVRLQTLQE
eukprot:1916653-Pyramimonas_sp.AAC.1